MKELLEKKAELENKISKLSEEISSIEELLRELKSEINKTCDCKSSSKTFCETDSDDGYGKWDYGYRVTCDDCGFSSRLDIGTRSDRKKDYCLKHFLEERERFLKMGGVL